MVILAILAVVNLRGVKDTGTAFIAPTFLFIGTLLALIGVGVYKTYAAGGHPVPVAAMPPALPQTVKFLGHVDAAEGVFQRVRGDDGRGGGIERGDGFWGAAIRRRRRRR